MFPDYGLTIIPRQIPRVPAVTVANFYFADDIALLSISIQDAQSLLHDLEAAAENVRLFMAASKTEFMIHKMDPDETSIVANYGDPPEHVHEFRYLGSYVVDS